MLNKDNLLLILCKKAISLRLKFSYSNCWVGTTGFIHSKCCHKCIIFFFFICKVSQIIFSIRRQWEAIWVAKYNVSIPIYCMQKQYICLSFVLRYTKRELVWELGEIPSSLYFFIFFIAVCLHLRSTYKNCYSL